jgi:hypothetical protein
VLKHLQPTTKVSSPWAIQAVSERLATSDIVKLLQHPLAAGDAQRALLDVLGHRTRHTFRKTWHFLDWASSNGVDLVPPARPAVLRP